MVEWAAQVASEESKQVTMCGGHQERNAHTLSQAMICMHLGNQFILYSTVQITAGFLEYLNLRRISAICLVSTYLK